MKITLPYPPANLSPNARQHWSKLAKAKREYRQICAAQAWAQGARKMDADWLEVTFTFYPPDKRRRDFDNEIARLKAGIDGLADVLGVDDSRWNMTFARADEIGGYVRANIGECNG